MKELARYSFPLKKCDVTIVITGEQPLQSEDFDALAEAMSLFKKQRPSRSRRKPAALAPSDPKNP